MRAAVSAVRTLKPARIVVAVPVASREAASAMHQAADAFLCAFLPSQLYSVGQWYQEFSQTTDAEVVQTEDYRVAAAGYGNMLSAPDDFHVVLGANEIALHGVHRHIAQACGMPLESTE